MKKLAAILLALVMTASLAACGGSGESSDTKETSAQSSASATSEAKAEETTVEETTASAELQEGDSGEGEKTLDSDFCTVTIPEGLQYKINAYYHDEDALGTIKIDFGKKGTTEGRLEVSTTRMISSLDDAVEECIRVRNLDTYEEGKSEIGEEVTYGDTTYKVVKMSHEYGAETCLVSYYKRADGKDIYVEIKTTQNDFYNLQIDDPLVQELAKSAVYK
ncbi:MAG: lipoprotein [Ruminococcus sp.]